MAHNTLLFLTYCWQSVTSIYGFSPHVLLAFNVSLHGRVKFKEGIISNNCGMFVLRLTDCSQEFISMLQLSVAQTHICILATDVSNGIGELQFHTPVFAGNVLF
jgi:hypothetical protein